MAESVGQQLRRAREARTLTLEQVAQATRIRERYVRALEEDDLSAVPSMAQARGFLRVYAGYLQLDPDSLLDSLDEADDLSQGPLAAAPPEGQPSGGPATESNSIFVEIGQKLLQHRELLGLSLEDVERHTHLRIHYLRALECGNMQGLPSPVQGRGMLKNYAAFLGLDSEPLLLRFAEGLQARLAANQAAQPDTRPRPGRREPDLLKPVRRLFTSELVIGGVLVLMLAGFILWGLTRILNLRSVQPPAQTAPSISEVLLAPPTPEPTATPRPPTPTPPPPPAPSDTPVLNATLPGSLDAGQTGSVQVYATIRQRTWIRVTVDGKIEFEGRVLPGTAYQFGGQKQVEILTGNGAAVQIFYGQQDLGTMGIFGQVVDWIFSTEGLLTPTPTATYTSSPTPRFSPTPQGTPTPQSTVIPLP
jgi:cytoskeleton protein RodZ